MVWPWISTHDYEPQSLHWAKESDLVRVNQVSFQTGHGDRIKYLWDMNEAIPQTKGR